VAPWQAFGEARNTTARSPRNEVLPPGTVKPRVRLAVGRHRKLTLQRALEGARPAGPSHGLPGQAFRDTDPDGGQFFVSPRGHFPMSLDSATAESLKHPFALAL
jgi:hypothetical protein